MNTNWNLCQCGAVMDTPQSRMLGRCAQCRAAGAANRRRIAIDPWFSGPGGEAVLIRLKGQWLKAAGFHAGAKVAVEVVSAGEVRLTVCAPVSVKASDPEFGRVMGVLDAALTRVENKLKAHAAGCGGGRGANCTCGMREGGAV